VETEVLFDNRPFNAYVRVPKRRRIPREGLGVCVCYIKSKQRWAGRIDYAISGVLEWNMEQEEGARV
jgi:hypothetical protein